MALDGETFGAWLKAERERRGVTLEQAADATKIKRSLLAALERNDLSQWPRGIFRRGFIREYAKVIGLSPDRVAGEFARLFPDDSIASPAADVAVRADGDDLRLTLVAASRPTARALGAALLTAAADSGVVLVAGYLLALLTGAHFWTTSGATALLYYPVALLLLREPPASWALNRVRASWRARPLGAAPTSRVETRDQLHVVSRRPAADALPERGDEVWRERRARIR